jgi:hypothetical protein
MIQRIKRAALSPPCDGDDKKKNGFSTHMMNSRIKAATTMTTPTKSKVPIEPLTGISSKAFF